MLNGSSALTLMFEPINKRRPVLINGLENETCLLVQTTTSWLNVFFLSRNLECVCCTYLPIYSVQQLFKLLHYATYVIFGLKGLQLSSILQESLYLSEPSDTLVCLINNYNCYTVRPRDTRPQAARTLQVHVFELGPKIFELNEFMQ